MTTFYQLFSLLQGTHLLGDLDRLQPAMYLAQRTTRQKLYRYRLCSGYVVSEDFAEDVEHLRSARSSERGADGNELSRQLAPLREALEHWLEREPDLLQALATTDFFRAHSYGEPSVKLKWFRALPDNVREEAGRVALELQSAG